MKSKLKSHLRKNSTVYEAIITSNEHKSSKAINTFVSVAKESKAKRPTNHRTFSEIPIGFSTNPLTKSKAKPLEKKKSTKLSENPISKMDRAHLSTEVEHSLNSPSNAVIC